MSTFDNKLAEWLKHVEQQEKELKTKKQSQVAPPQEAPKPVASEPAARLMPEAPARETTTATTVIDEKPVTTPIVAQTPKPEPKPAPQVQMPAEEIKPEMIERIEKLEPLTPKAEETKLFEEDDVSTVEDFLSFLGRSRETTTDSLDVPFTQSRGIDRLDLDGLSRDGVKEEAAEESTSIPFEQARNVSEAPVVDDPDKLSFGTREVPYPVDRVSEPVEKSDDVELPFDLRTYNNHLDMLVEGTGEPRPIHELLKSAPQPEAEVEPDPIIMHAPVVEEPAIIETEVRAEVVPAVEPVIRVEPQVAPVQPSADKTDESSVQASWDRMPHHLQTLFAAAELEEVAQHSYKTFKENRGQLIQRLLDPVISLEEAARILNVCPTTVRRYTNRGVLKHIRTAGNQRRFRLSDVLTFMEGSSRAEKIVE